MLCEGCGQYANKLVKINCKNNNENLFRGGVNLKKLILLITITLMLIPSYLFYNGYLRFNNPDLKKYQVRGIDVSNHQGVINWDKVKEQGYEFAFIKATEGMDFKDAFFDDNWKNTKAVGISRGAYHFFTFGSSGLDQAKILIATVPAVKDMLPIVIDIELGGNSKKLPTKDKFKNELTDFINEIEIVYKHKPILYLTYESYNKYIKGDFEEYRIWIRDVFMFPKFKDGQNWILWQYCNRGRVKGIKGFVDLNTFKGSSEEFNKMLLE